MRKTYWLILFFGHLIVNASAQEDVLKSSTDHLKEKKLDTIQGWKVGGASNLTFAQVSLSNWASGGQNSVALNSSVNLYASLVKGAHTWDNNLDLGFGLVKQNGESVKKSDDRIDFSSKYGRKVGKSERLYYAGILNFRSQFAPGYNYPNDTVKISNFLAPGYILLALGFDWKPVKNMTVFLAPITNKTTIVNNQTLADAGAFGVDPAKYDENGMKLSDGKRIRYEIGGYFKAMYKFDIGKTATFSTRLDLFSNYLHNPQNIDVYWENNLVVKVSKYIGMTVGTLLIYDDDVKVAVDNNHDGVKNEWGPRIQFRQIFGLGFSYKFNNGN